ncbi:hydrogenase maturation nickel metallochaperone HypA [Helicobacter sp. 11S02629-2]|uniref:hydrogenase maturation nickel metallochaperone HypA/HybF n=1 Tax=Helicobacter sp. 11S02629-2 TaxID=1476195 RepID=UPI000BA5E9F3|nr:hydrogenase maturation nickel metallochaperone HypA [Helicobacter sp. 11S02629-2]PAF44967.1 hypothetical protein BKH40_04585 [Helicobacter sp. 11S02629-2]
MHEYSIASHLLSLCEENFEKALKDNDLNPLDTKAYISKIVVSIGERSNIEPKLLESAFSILQVESPCTKDSILEIIRVPLSFKCETCGHSFYSSTSPLCPNCNSSHTQIVDGREIRLEKLEIEN